MILKLNNGEEINLISYDERKIIFATPQMWELELLSNNNYSSVELDEILTTSNISHMTVISDKTESIHIYGYNTVVAINKSVTDNVRLVIKLQKEAKQDEN